MEKSNLEEKTKVLRVDAGDFGLFEKLMINFIVGNEVIITKKEFFGILIKNAIKKGTGQAPKNTSII